MSSTFSAASNIGLNPDYVPSLSGGGGGAVSSVFGRTGVVIAVAGDYNSTQITNSSGVTGAFVTDALNTLNSGKLSTTLTSANIIVGNGSNVATAVAMSGDATISNTGAVTLKNTGTAGTYGSATQVPVLTTDAQGRVTGVTNIAITGFVPTTLTSGNIIVGNGSNVATAVVMSGDATISNTGAVTLKNTGTAGTYGSATQVPVLTTDAQGRVTGVTNTTLSAVVYNYLAITLSIDTSYNKAALAGANYLYIQTNSATSRAITIDNLGFIANDFLVLSFSQTSLGTVSFNIGTASYTGNRGTTYFAVYNGTDWVVQLMANSMLSVAGSQGSTILGTSANGGGHSTVTAIGFDAVVTGASGVALGSNVSAASQSIVVGSGTANATGTNSVSIGYNATGSGINSVRIGSGTATGSNTGVVAIGQGITTTTQDAVIIGRGAATSGATAVSIGRQSQANGSSNVAIGDQAVSNGTSTISIGVNASSTGNTSVLVGGSSSSTGANTVIIGNGITASTNTGVVAIGQGITSTAIDAVGIGRTVGIGGIEAIAIGRAAEATANGSIAIGGGADSLAAGTVVIGQNGSSSGANTVAIGLSVSTGVNTGVVAIGQGITTTNTDAVIIGRAASGGGTANVTIGGSATGTGANCVRIGNGVSTSTATGVIAIGQGISAFGNDTITIGRGSLGGTNTINIGTANTGNINNTIKLGNALASVNTDNSILIGNTVTNVASGNSIIIGHSSQSTSDNSIAIGNSSNANGSDSIAIGGSASVTGSGSIGIGRATVTVSQSFSVAIGHGARSTTKTRQFAKGAYAYPLHYGAESRRIDTNTSTTDATNPSRHSDNTSWNGQTTNNTITELFLFGVASERLTLQDNEIFTATIHVQAKRNATTDCFVDTAFVSIIRGSGAGTATLVLAPSSVNSGFLGTGSTVTYTLSADTTNGSLRFQATGNASETWQWTANIINITRTRTA